MKVCAFLTDGFETVEALAVVCGSYCGPGMWKINAYPDV